MTKLFEEILTNSIAKKNFERAQLAFQYTLSVIKGSSNRLSASEIKTKNGQDIIDRMNQMREEEIEAPLYSLAWIKEVALKAERFGVGNCCEKACVTFYFLYSLLNSLSNEPVNIELFNNPIADHFFVVIGRDPATAPQDPQTWNADAIICDPWVENRSYFIGEVDFKNMKQNPWHVLNYLLPFEGSPGPIELKRDVLTKANDVRDTIICSQDIMVLRAGYHEGVFNSYNSNIPMCYEQWDLPKEKHYLKQKKLNESKVDVSKKGFFSTEKQEEFPVKPPTTETKP